MKRLSAIHSILERLETEIEKQLHKIDTFRQSILVQAFFCWIAAGVVERKPEYEHSSVLLERIKTEREERSRTRIIPRRLSCVAVAA